MGFRMWLYEQDFESRIRYRVFKRLGARDPYKHPHLFALSFLSTFTWIRHPSWNWESYRRHVTALIEDNKYRELTEDKSDD